MLFKQLTDEEKADYRRWARENYEPLSTIEGIWHPVVQQECAEINRLHCPPDDEPDPEPCDDCGELDHQGCDEGPVDPDCLGRGPEARQI